MIKLQEPWCWSVSGQLPSPNQCCLCGQRVTSSPSTGGNYQHTSLISTSGSLSLVPRSWGLGALLGMLVSGGVSGGHLNPAVSLAVASIGKFPWWKVGDMSTHFLYSRILNIMFLATDFSNSPTMKITSLNNVN